MSEPPTISEWVVLQRTTLLDLRPWLTVHSETVQLPTGRTVERFYTLEMPAYVVVIALTDDGRVVTERNYKHGPRRVCLNLPAGYINRAEDPLSAAKRELLEETGYAADEWRSLGSFANDGNRGAGTGHFFLAPHAHPMAEPNSGDLEEMELHLVTLEELGEAVRRGEMPVLSNAAAFALAFVTLAQR